MKKLEESFDVKSLALRLVVGVIAVLAIAIVGVIAVKAYNGQLFGDCNNCTINLSDATQAVGEVFGGGSRFRNGLSADSTSPVDGEVRGTTLTITDGMNYQEGSVAGTATTTLVIGDSGNTYYLSGSSQVYTLPATTTADGAVFRFVVAGSLTGTTTVVTASSINGIEGALIVAGAVVDCAAEDTIQFWYDGENVGDFVELRSNGTNWFIGASGGLTAGKLTCEAT